ncbi:MAG: hypothetical protein LBP59_04770 [Planctomycetaceae bacterium]|jgi:hypothetical protein|nr:hypothetical protein [Planctomycetaceae bacterium]
MEVLITLLTQCPALGAFIWFLVTNTKQNQKMQMELMLQFQNALDKVVEKIGDRLDRIEKELIRIKE